jgi:hypothetical protein
LSSFYNEGLQGLFTLSSSKCRTYMPWQVGPQHSLCGAAQIKCNLRANYKGSQSPVHLYSRLMHAILLNQNGINCFADCFELAFHLSYGTPKAYAIYKRKIQQSSYIHNGERYNNFSIVICLVFNLLCRGLTRITNTNYWTLFYLFLFCRSA